VVFKTCPAQLCRATAPTRHSRSKMPLLDRKNGRRRLPHLAAAASRGPEVEEVVQLQVQGGLLQPVLQLREAADYALDARPAGREATKHFYPSSWRLQPCLLSCGQAMPSDGLARRHSTNWTRVGPWVPAKHGILVCLATRGCAAAPIAIANNSKHMRASKMCRFILGQALHHCDNAHR
jgi:hypothetical protein